MSDDLISRKSLMKKFKKWKRLEHLGCHVEWNKAIEKLIIILRDEQTAYDVDAVCEQMDKASDYYETDEQGKEHVRMLNLTDAIEIARNGGKK